MPTYRLHIEYERREKSVDLDGVEFPDEAAALAEAHLGLRELLAAAIMEATEGPSAIAIEDVEGRHVATVNRLAVIPLSWTMPQ
jgi:hypothetical protein